MPTISAKSLGFKRICDFFFCIKQRKAAFASSQDALSIFAKKEGWISPAFQKDVSIIFAQNLLKRIRKLGILLLRPLWAPLGVLSGTEELFVFVSP